MHGLQSRGLSDLEQLSSWTQPNDKEQRLVQRAYIAVESNLSRLDKEEAYLLNSVVMVFKVAE